MNPISLDPNDRYTLMRIGEAWRNRGGLVTLILTFLMFVLLSGIGASTESRTLFAVFGLIAAVTYLVGICAAGIQFMDQAAGRPVTTTIGALLTSPIVTLRSLGLIVVLLVASLAFAVVEVVVLFVCKIPGLGPLLFAIAFPVLVFANSLVLLGLVVVAALAFPALCEGRSLKATLAQLWAIATQRPVQAILSLMLLFIGLLFVGGLVASLIGVGFVNAAFMSGAILAAPMGDGFSSVPGMLMGGGFGGFGGGGSGGLVMAAAFGSALVFGITGALFAAMALLGLSLTYLKVTSGIDVSAAQAVVDSAIAKTREKAQLAAEEARRRAHEAQLAAQQRLEQTRASQAARAAPPPPAALACPSCHATVLPEEAFCGTCGHKLK